MSTSTIQEDVQNVDPAKKEIALIDDNPDNVAKEPQLSPREQAMEQVAATRRQLFDQEMAGDTSGVLKPAPAAEVPPATGEVDELAVQQAAQAAEQAAAADDLLKRTIKVKINGVESEATIEDMQRQYQKGESADRRLADAARRERELEAKEAALQAKLEEAAKAAAAPAKAEPVDPLEAKEFTAAMFGGDEEKAVAAFEAAVAKAVDRKMQGRQAATQEIDIDQITATVEQRFAVNNALQKSQADYPDLYADPDMEALAAAKIQRKQAEGLSFTEALETTGSEMAAKFGWQKPGHQPKADTTVRDTKLARKEALDPVAGVSVKISTQEVAPQTHSDVIAEMRKQRGQIV